MLKKIYSLAANLAIAGAALCYGTQASAQCDVIYASPTGNALNDGSEANPMDLQTAVAEACLQNRLHVRLLSGTYNLSDKIVIDCDDLIIDGDWEVVSGIGRKNSSLTTIININSPLETAAFDQAICQPPLV